MALLLGTAGCAGLNAQHPGTPAEWRSEFQPPLQQEETRQLSDGISLADAVRIGCERNPGAEAARRRWLAAIHVEPQALTPPDPTVQAEFPFQKMITLMGRQQWGGGLTQTVPWPQKLWAAGRIASADADIAELRYESALRDVIIEVKDSYYELFYLDQAIPITQRIEEFLRNDAILAYSELTVGRTQLNEAFRAESQAAQLAYDRMLLEEQRAAQAERLKALLNLPPATPVGPVRDAPVYPVADEVDELYLRAENYAEVLRIRGLETQRAAYETFLAKLARIPDLSLGLNLLRLTQTSVMLGGGGSAGPGAASGSPPGETPIGSDMNMTLGTVGMNLPIFEWRNQQLVAEKKALEEAMRLDALDQTNRVRASVAETYFQVRLTGRLVQLYSGALLPQAEAAMRQAEILFRSDQSSFSNVLETTLAYHNFTLAWLRARADHGQAIGRLETVLGTTAEPREAPKTDDNAGGGAQK